MKLKLDTVANIAIIMVSMTVMAYLINNYFFSKKPSPPQNIVREGERLEPLSRFIPVGAERALVIVLSPNCGYCAESMPFYKRVSQQRVQKGSSVKIVAAVGTPKELREQEKVLEKYGVQVENVVVLDFMLNKISGTPTLLVVNKNGEILRAWNGKLDQKSEQEVIKEL